MKLSIQNYKNISNLNLDIIDNRINFIFGISGSGKTSIGQAISKNIIDEEVMIGKNISDVIIKVNNEEINYEKVSLYNENIVDSLIVDNDMNSNIYNIFFSNDDKIICKIDEFKEAIKDLSKFKSVMYEYSGKVDILMKNYGGKLTKKNELPATSKIVKLEKALDNGKNEKYVKIIKNSESNYLPWINEGKKFKSYVDSKICPYCEQTVPLDRIKIIEELCEFTPKDFNIIFDNTNTLKDLNIKVPDYSNPKEIKVMEDNMIEKIKLKNELENIINIIDYYVIENYNPSSICDIIVSDSFKKEFPEITESITKTNDKIKEIKKLLGELRQVTDKTIHDNIKVLNNYIEKFGIPYKFKKNKYDIENKKADYILYHINDDLQKHRTNNLSYGEKNIISLLLFLLSNKNKIVIIDDPASSYDDYRRKIIFNLLYDLQDNNTIMVLSHDMVFVKYAVLSRYKGSKLKNLKKFFEKTGKIISFENYNYNIVLKDIDYNDFGTIENQVKEHICNNKLSYYRKIINLRILAEIKNHIDVDYEIIYNYLSAILHKEEKIIIIEKLKEKNCDEDKVLSMIEGKFNIKLEKMPDDILEDFNVNELTNFEKIFYFRDDINDETIKDEFNNIIHMNSAYMITLNPYKYNYFSPYVYDIINS